MKALRDRRARRSLAAALLLAPASQAASFSMRAEPPAIVQGGITLITVAGPPGLPRPTGSFGGKALRFFPGPALGSWDALAGADLNAKLPAVTAKVTLGGESQTLKVGLKAGDYPVERLTLPKGKVSPTKKEVLDRIWGDRKRAKAAGLHDWEHRFMGELKIPCEGRLNHNFGKRRILNGTPKSPHGGEDISAPTGTPVFAAAPGTVRLVDDMFYSGKTLFVDHGSGWMTTYFHLSKVTVEEGQAVTTETKVGEVGATGRVTGPHLHWGLQWRRSRVDPLLLVRAKP